MDMFAWIEKGFALTGTPIEGVFIASKNEERKHAVLVTRFDGTLERRSEWFRSHSQAVSDTRFAMAHA